MRLVVATLVLAVGVLGVGVGEAWAHAELSATEPVAGAVADNSPDQVVLSFTEDVSVEGEGVRVLDATAGRHDRGEAKARGRTVTVPLRGVLPDGGYVVAWRVVSADGHPIHGAFQFSVGKRTVVDSEVVDRAFGAGGDRRDEVIAAVLRAISYGAVLVVAGAVLVGTRLGRADEPSPVSRRLGVLAGVGVLALLFQVPVRASLATGRGWGSVTEVGLLGRSLADGMGWSLGLSMVGMVMVAITAGLPFKGAVRTIAGAGAAVAPLGFALTGHTRTMVPAWAGMVADLAHLAAAAIWLGGLVALIGILRRRRAAGDVIGSGEAVAGFSGLAAVALVGVAMSGAAMATIVVGGLGPLTSTTYGRLLMAKVALVALVAAAGGWNRLRLVPVLAPDPDGDDAPLIGDPRWQTLARILRVEVGVLLVVVAVTAALVNVTPARTASATSNGSDSRGSAPRGPVEASAPLGDGSVEVVISPGRAGTNQVDLRLLAGDGRPDDRYPEASVDFSLPALDVGPIEGQVERVGPGRFRVEDADLAIAGSWVVTVTVQPDRFSKLEAEVKVEVAG